MADSAVSVSFDYTYDGQLLTEVLMKPSIDTPAMNTLFMPKTGFKYKQQIPLVANLSKITKAYSSCARTFTDGIPITNTTLTLKELEVNLEWCKDDFEGAVGNILSETYLKNGVMEFDPEGTEIQSIIDELVLDAMRRDNFRLISFGDENDADADWNQLNGLWTQLLGEDGQGSSYCVEAPVTDLGTGDLAAGAALAALKSVTEGAPIILKQYPLQKKYIAVTGSVFENLLGSYEANTNGTENQFTLLQQGPTIDGNTPSLKYRGIPVIPIYAWDSALADTTNPLDGNVKHLILYTTRDNHAVGMDVQADANSITGWYERKDRKYYIEGFHRLGYTYLHCDLQSIGY